MATWLFSRSDVNHAAWCVATYGIRYDLCSRFSNSISLQTADVDINAFINGIEHLVAEHRQTVFTIKLFANLCVSSRLAIAIYKNVLYICQLVVFLKGCGDEYGSIHTQTILLQADEADGRLIGCISALGFITPLKPCTSDMRAHKLNTRESRFILD